MDLKRNETPEVCQPSAMGYPLAEVLSPDPSRRYHPPAGSGINPHWSRL